MTNSQDYRKYLEQRFSDLTTLVNAQFDNVHERLGEIHEQTKKINGRVSDVEKDIVDLQVTDELHYKECPVIPIVTKLEKDINELKIEAVTVWIKKHWKLSIFLFIITLYFSYEIFDLFSIQELIKLLK